MKHMRKLMALLLVVIMIMAMSVTAMAAESNCSITIEANAPTGSDVSEIKYYARKVFDAEFTPDFTGPIDDNTKVTYSFLKTDTDVLGVVNGKPEYFSVTPSADGEKYYVQLTAAGAALTGADLARLFYSLAWISNDDAVQIPYVSASGNYYLDGLEPGYYVIGSSLGSNMFAKTIGDVVIEQKNGYPTIELSSVNTVDNNNEVEFTVDVHMPANGLGGQDGDGVTVSFDVPADLSIDLSTLAATIDGTSFTVYPRTGENAFYIDYTSPGWEGKTIKVTFKGTADALANDLTLTAKATHNEYTSAPSSVTISNGTVSVYKYTNTEGVNTGLAGAGFVLTKTVQENSADVTKYYHYDGNTKTVSWVDSIENASEYTTASNNQYKVQFVGLAEGNYTVVEKTVPGGYTQAQPADVEIKVENGIAGDASTEILNVAGSVLPSTGGMGTTLFYILGGLMVVVALVVLVTNKRMRRT